MKMQKVKLGDIFELQMGKTPSRNNSLYWDNGRNKWVSISDLSVAGKYIENTKEKITDIAVKESGIKLVPKNTIIMSFKLSIGKTAITKEDIYTNEAIMAFIDKKGCLFDINYLYHLFSGYDWLDGSNKAVLGLTLNKATLSQKIIPVSSIEEQKAIAERLDKISELIDKRKEQINKLDLLIKSRFIEMFGDPNENNKNLLRIGGVGKLQSGGTPSRTNPEYFKGKIRWYSAGELNSLFLNDSIEHISKEGIEQSSAKIFKKGTLMIGMYDTAAFKMGILTEDSASNQACANFEPNSDFDVVWLYYLFTFMKDKFLMNRHGVRQQNLSLTVIRDLKFPSASKDMQCKFVLYVKQIEKLKLYLKCGLNKLDTLKKSLMQQYFG